MSDPVCMKGAENSRKVGKLEGRMLAISDFGCRNLERSSFKLLGYRPVDFGLARAECA